MDFAELLTSIIYTYMYIYIYIYIYIYASIISFVITYFTRRNWLPNTIYLAKYIYIITLDLCSEKYACEIQSRESYFTLLASFYVTCAFNSVVSPHELQSFE